MLITQVATAAGGALDSGNTTPHLPPLAPLPFYADLEDRARWPEYFGWLVGNLEKLHAAFSERVKHLEIEENQPAE